MKKGVTIGPISVIAALLTWRRVVALVGWFKARYNKTRPGNVVPAGVIPDSSLFFTVAEIVKTFRS
jgi:hypothetical protein